MIHHRKHAIIHPGENRRTNASQRTNHFGNRGKTRGIGPRMIGLNLTQTRKPRLVFAGRELQPSVLGTNRLSCELGRTVALGRVGI